MNDVSTRVFAVVVIGFALLHGAAQVRAQAVDTEAGVHPKLAAALQTQGAINREPGARGLPSRKSVRDGNGATEFDAADISHGIQRKVPRDPVEVSSAVDLRSNDFDTFMRTANSTEPSDADAKVRVSRAGVRAAETDIRAAFIEPTNGATLRRDQLFRWSEGIEPQMYWIWVGSCQDCTDILDAGMGLSRQYTVSMPLDGRSVYVTLFTLHRGYWYWYDYRFRAPNGNGEPAQMLSPKNGATLNSRQTFTWSEGNSVAQYFLWVGSCQDCTDILEESQGNNLSKTVSLPQDGRTIFVTLFSHLNGDWHWFDYQFRAPQQGANASDVQITITNRLAWGVNILVNGAVVGSVPAFETRAHHDRLSSLELSWELNQPAPFGRELGDKMGGTFEAITSPSGEYKYEIDNRIGDSWYFAPYITNRTSVPLLIEVNGGLEVENRCNCTAPANSTNVATGYYRLYSNSNVRLWRSESNYTGSYRFWGTDSDGRVSSGGKLHEHTEESSGILRLTATVAP